MTNAQNRSKYSRQLAPGKMREGENHLGLDVYASWSSAIYFWANWRNLDPPATVGAMYGPRGEVTAFSLPAIPVPKAIIALHDVDAAVQLQLEHWKYDRNILRWHAPGHHIAICMISAVTMSRPVAKILEAELIFTSIFFYDPAINQHDVNFDAWPDLTAQGAQGRLYGAALGIIPPPPPP
jgi:hypothetical protein